MRHRALSSRAVLALSTAALVAITSAATALVVLTGTATLVGSDDALDPRPPARAGDALAVVQLPGFRTPGAALISTLPGRGVVGFAPQLPGPVPAVPPRGVLFTVPVSPVVLGPTGAVVALLTGAPVPTATVQSEKAAQRLAKEASTLAVPTTPTLALVQSRLVTTSPAPGAVDARDRTAAATKSAGAKKAAAKKAAAKQAAAKKAAAGKAGAKQVAAGKGSPRKSATTYGRTSVVKPAAGAAKKALAR